MRKENFEIVWYEQPVEYGFTIYGIFGALYTKQRILNTVPFKFGIYDFIIINGNIYRTEDYIQNFCEEVTENYYIMAEHNNTDVYSDFMGVYAIFHTSDEIGIPEKILKLYL